MSKRDLRDYKLLKLHSIYSLMAAYIAVFTFLNICFTGTVGLLLIPMFCLILGWQLGCLTERNDWQIWARKHDYINTDKEQPK